MATASGNPAPATPQPPAALALDAEVGRRLEAAFSAASERPDRGFLLDLRGSAPIPAACVRWLLIDALPGLAGRITRAALWHASVTDELRLRGLALAVTPAFVQCDLYGIDITDATLPGLEVIAGRLGLLRADRCTVAGSLLVRGATADRTYHHDLPDDAHDTVDIPHGVLLCGASIRGNLDLRGAQVGPLPPAGTEPIAVSADGVQVQGNALLCDGFAADGEVRLNGCIVARDLDLSGAQLMNPQGDSLSAVSAQIRGRLRLCRGANGRPSRAQGALYISESKIDSDLDASDAELTASGFVHQVQNVPADQSLPPHVLIALFAGGCSIGGSLTLGGCKTRGQIWVSRSQIGKDFDLGQQAAQETSLHFPGESALVADAVEVKGFTFLIGTRTNGLLKFLNARLEGGCACLGVRLSALGSWADWKTVPYAEEEIGTDVCGLYFAAVKIGGALVWRDATREPARGVVQHGQLTVDENRKFWFSAQSASLGELDDNLPSWDAVDRINLVDCSYGRIENLGRPLGAADPNAAHAAAEALERTYPSGTDDWVWRLDVLDREYADPELGPQQAILRFSPTPYLQLAGAYQKAGLLGAAREVLLRLERNRTRFSGLPRRRIRIRQMLDFTVRYGLEPLRLVPIVLVWTLASGVLFKWVHDLHRMQALGPEHPRFNWFFYALDTLVPFVDFGQKKSFAMTNLFSWGGALLLCNALFGYVLIGILGGVVSGVVRSGKDVG